MLSASELKFQVQFKGWLEVQVIPSQAFLIPLLISRPGQILEMEPYKYIKLNPDISWKRIQLPLTLCIMSHRCTRVQCYTIPISEHREEGRPYHIQDQDPVSETQESFVPNPCILWWRSNCESPPQFSRIHLLLTVIHSLSHIHLSRGVYTANQMCSWASLI